jgi:hypothetical protein
MCEHDAALEPVLVRLKRVRNDEVCDASWIVVAELVSAARADLREARRILVGSTHPTSS